MKYRFTNTLPKRQCRICGSAFPEDWSDGGVGAVCESCFQIRQNLDLVDEGIIRNIQLANGAYTFEALIDDKWYKAYMACGDWSYIKGWPEYHDIFSVPVGFWELDRLYKKHL